jgi:hypothetical protein
MLVRNHILEERAEPLPRKKALGPGGGAAKGKRQDRAKAGDCGPGVLVERSAIMIGFWEVRMRGCAFRGFPRLQYGVVSCQTNEW